jgi:hypothetical protein
MKTFINALIVLGIGIVGQLWGCRAYAARLDSGDIKTIYVEAKTGKRLDAVEAFKRGMNADADEILACKPVEMVCNQRTGKCNLKNAK